jgi:hypothetical protein
LTPISGVNSPFAFGEGGAKFGLWRLHPYMPGQFAIVVGIACRQHGRVCREQLLAAGVDGKRIDRWLGDSRLTLVHRGVYAVGHQAPSLRGDYMAAVLACGEGAVLSHRAATQILRLLPGVAAPPEVTVPTLAGRQRPGIVIHRVKALLHPRDVAIVDGIPITTVPRALLDMAPSLEPRELTRACHEAWIRHRTSPRDVEACIARNPKKHGGAKLRTALGSDATLSKLEDGFLALLHAHGLPRPRTNIDHHGDKVDCHWPQLGLTVELLSFRFHGTRRAFETDVARRRRSNHIAYTWGDVFERPHETIAELAATMREA